MVRGVEGQPVGGHSSAGQTVLESVAGRRQHANDVNRCSDVGPPTRRPRRGSWNSTGPRAVGSSWHAPMWASSFHSKQPPLVPDVFVSLDTELATGAANKAYFPWEHKAPELVVEVVSNNEGKSWGPSSTSRPVGASASTCLRSRTLFGGRRSPHVPPPAGPVCSNARALPAGGGAWRDVVAWDLNLGGSLNGTGWRVADLGFEAPAPASFISTSSVKKETISATNSSRPH